MSLSPGRRSASERGSSVGCSTTRSGGEGSSTICRFLIKVVIDVFLERFDAGAVHHVNEAFVFAVPQFKIGFDQALDDLRNIGARKGRADDLAEGGRRARPDFPLVAADFDLVPLFPVLIDAQNSD